MTYTEAKENLLHAVNLRSEARATVAKLESALRVEKARLAEQELAVLEAEMVEHRAIDERLVFTIERTEQYLKGALCWCGSLTCGYYRGTHVQHVEPQVCSVCKQTVDRLVSVNGKESIKRMCQQCATGGK
jgi:hypothetical protein